MKNLNKTSTPINSPVFDQWQTVALALAMTVAGYSVLVGIPVLTSSWVEFLSYSDEQVGRLAGADLGGLSLGAVLTAFMIAKVNRQKIALTAITLAVISNLLCYSMSDYHTVLALRFIAGIASGIFTAIAVATCAANSKPERVFTLMLFMFVFTQACELWLLDKLDLGEIYLLFAGSYLVFIPLLKFLPSHPVDASDTIELANDKPPLIDMPKYLPLVSLVAIFVAYINIGSYWTYIELAAINAGISEEWTNQALITASLLAITACGLTLYLGNKFGMLRTLMVALLAMSFFVFIMSGNVSDISLLSSLIGFNFLWIFIDVYQMSTLSKIDHSGRFTSLMPAAQGLGQIVGPNISASILAWGWSYDAVFSFCAIACLLSFAIYGALLLILKFKSTSLDGTIKIH